MAAALYRANFPQKVIYALNRKGLDLQNEALSFFL